MKYSNEESVAMVSSAMAAFNHDIFEEELVEFEQRFYEVLPEIFATKESEYAKAFYSHLSPISDNIEFQQKEIERLLNSKLESDVLIKVLKES